MQKPIINAVVSLLLIASKVVHPYVDNANK
jgi:hypothetical protein